MTAPLPERLKSLFGDLGKPTLRGVRKCPKCGTFNGTRGLSCKNKRCDVVFKDREKKKVQSVECVKIITADSINLYSVRLRDRGVDCRGFVQLPTVLDSDGNITLDPVDPGLLLKAARCYVDSCSGKAPGSGDECSHVRAAIACTRSAEPLEITASGIDAVAGLPDDVRSTMLSLITESPGPVVQRVTRNIMVVRCHVSYQHPLGFLHFTFPVAAKDRADRIELQRKVICGCRMLKNVKDYGMNFKCSHFYACVCAFASNENLANEFQHFLKSSAESQPDNGVVMLLDLEDVLLSVPSSSITNDHNLVDLDRHSQIMSSGSVASGSDILLSAAVSQEPLVHGDEIVDSQAFELIVEGDSEEVELDDGSARSMASKRLKLSEDQIRDTFTVPARTVDQPSATVTLAIDQASASVTPSLHSIIDIHDPTAASNIVLLKPNVNVGCMSSSLSNRMQNSHTSKTVDESEVMMTFEDWLSSVTERINQTMHYQFGGNPGALVFHIPQKFFDCLQQRMSVGVGGRKKRLPNMATSFERRDAPPLGNFMKYTWQLTNLLHVKQIFDTRQRSLEIARRFVENRDGTFSLCESPDASVPNEVFAGKPPIRPFELKTFLKVGNLMVGQRDPTPFILEWIPDILPQSHIGELRITFQYGHQRNGVVEVRSSACRSDDLTSHP